MKKLYLLVLLFTYNTTIMAAGIWLPATVAIKFPGLDIAQDIPLPVDGKPGAAVGDKFGAGFFPVIGGEVGFVRRIYAEEPLNEKRDTLDSIQGLSGGEIFLNSNNPQGYRVHYSNNKSISLAGGAKIGPGGFLFLNASLKIGANFSNKFLYNKHVNSIREAKNIGSLINPEIPLDLESLNKVLSQGDSLSYIKSGDIFINFSAGAGWLANVGVAGSVASDWNVTIGRPKNISDGMVQVSYKKGKARKFSLNIGNLISGFDISWLKEKSRQITFLFDLNNKKEVPENYKKLIITKFDNRIKDLILKNKLKKVAKQSDHPKLIEKDDSYEIDLKGMTTRLAYELAVKGDLSIADLLSQDKSFGITKISIEAKTGKKRNLSASFKVPWLYTANFTKSEAQTFTDLKKLTESLDVITYNGLVSRNWSTSGPLSDDLNRTKVFSGIVQVIRDINFAYSPVESMRYAGNLSFAAEKNNATPNQIVNELRNVKNIFGLKKIFDPLIVKIKDIKERSKGIKVRSFNLKADLILSDLAIETISEISKKLDKDIITEVHRYIDGFAKKYESIDYKTGESFDPTKRKNKLLIKSVAKKELCRGSAHKVLSLCIKELKTEVSKQIKKALKAATIIDGFIVNKDEKFMELINKEINQSDKILTLFYNDSNDSYIPPLANYEYSNNKPSPQTSNDHSKDKLATFAKALADLGDAISYNRFTLKTYLRLLRYECTPYVYKTFLKTGPASEAQLKCPERKIQFKMGNSTKSIRVPYQIKFSLQSSELPATQEVIYGKEFEEFIN